MCWNRICELHKSRKYLAELREEAWHCRRENGGNCDIKNLTKGCKVYFPGAHLPRRRTAGRIWKAP